VHVADRFIPTVTRMEVIARDGEACRYCGCLLFLPGTGLTIDHILPRSRGGTNEPGNLAVCCTRCNNRKGEQTPEEWGHILLPPGLFTDVIKYVKDLLGELLVQPYFISCRRGACQQQFDCHTTYGGGRSAASRLFCSAECALIHMGYRKG